MLRFSIAQLLSQRIKDRYRDDRVFEEASGAAAIRIARHQQHSFLGADEAHRLAHFGQRGRHYVAGSKYRARSA